MATLASPTIAVASGDATGADAEQIGSDLDAVVARFGVELPGAVTAEAERAIGARLAELAVRWRAIEDRGSIVLAFPSR